MQCVEVAAIVFYVFLNEFYVFYAIVITVKKAI